MNHNYKKSKFYNKFNLHIPFKYGNRKRNDDGTFENI